MRHPYHLVDLSAWPLLVSMTLLSFAYNLVNYLSGSGQGEKQETGRDLQIVIQIQIVQAALWWRDVVREGHAGYHTEVVAKGILQGFLLFVQSEIMQFFSFFWCFFHSSQAPGIEIGVWPPYGIHVINYLAVPLQGTTILQASSQVQTISHHAVLYGKKSQACTSLQITVIQGMTFLSAQYAEYRYSEFTLSDSIFGNIFYFTTGLHALHVIVGVAFLAISQILLQRNSVTSEHHKGFLFAVYYYHFVDVVWIQVYLIYYWWGM